MAAQRLRGGGMTCPDCARKDQQLQQLHTSHQEDLQILLDAIKNMTDTINNMGHHHE